MLMRDLLISTTANRIQHLTGVLGVAEECAFNDDNYTSDFLEDKTSALLIHTTQGDFNFGVQLYLFNTDDAALDAMLISVSKHGIAVAQPNESSDSPFDYVLFLDGEKQDCEIDTDEIFDEVFVINPKHVRKTLRALQADTTA